MTDDPGEIGEVPTAEDIQRAIELAAACSVEGIAQALAEARATGYAMGWNDGSTEATARSW